MCKRHALKSILPLPPLTPVLLHTWGLWLLVPMEWPQSTQQQHTFYNAAVQHFIQQSWSSTAIKRPRGTDRKSVHLIICFIHALLHVAVTEKRLYTSGSNLHAKHLNHENENIELYYLIQFVPNEQPPFPRHTNMFQVLFVVTSDKANIYNFFTILYVCCCPRHKAKLIYGAWFNTQRNSSCYMRKYGPLSCITSV